jgi:membrane protein implicated in regulation of membrane protease activity
MASVDGMGDYDWVAWLGLAVVLGIVEVTSLDLVFAMLAAGAVAAALTALVTDNIVVQALVAILVSVGGLAVLRPVALRHLKTPHAIRTGTAALVGERGLVLAPVSRDGGQVKIKGEVWSARTYDPHASVIEAGSSVQIVEIDGATALVYEAEV